MDQEAKAAAHEPTKTWEEYWESMLVDTEWADGYFIRSTAWYLNMIIQIMDTKCRPEEPYYRIEGDFTGESCTDILYIGYVSEVHYQSLLIDYTESVEIDTLDENVSEEESFKLPSIEDQKEEMNIDDQKEGMVVDDSTKDDEIYHSDEDSEADVTEDIDEIYYSDEDREDDGTDLTLPRTIKQEKEDRCPICRKTFKNLIMHIRRGKKCKVLDSDLRRLEERSKIIEKEIKRNWARKNREKLKREDHEKLKGNQNDWKLKSRENQKNGDHKILKENQNDWKLDSRKRLRDEDYTRETKKIRDSTAKSREKLKEADPEGYKKRIKMDNESKKLRQDNSDVDRLRRFQEAVMYGPMFVCVSCHGKMFRCSVKILTNRIVAQIDKKIAIQDCIDFDMVTKVVTESRNVNWPP